MLERRTLYDDSRGMGEGVVDNRKTINKFWLLLEDITHVTSNRDSPNRFANTEEGGDKGEILRNFNLPTNIPEPLIKSENFARPSLYANQMSNALNYPVSIYILEQEANVTVFPIINLINNKFPCDIHLMTLRTQPDSSYTQFPSSSSLMILHRQGYDCLVNSNYVCDVTKFERSTKFENVQIKQIQQMTLTGLDKIGRSFEDFSKIHIKPMALNTYNVTFG